MYAVIADSGTQWKVELGDVLDVDLRDVPTDSQTLIFDKVLLLGDSEDGAKSHVGTPWIEGASVTASILGQDKSPRVEVVKFKRRKTYLRRKGHRQDFLKVKITSIDGPNTA